ncbi:TerB family tellurite resistance protein [Alphaproteobacteria bacterium]|nr:TerB family tellurite resistance protein [Alphaproteobacteria bacterium]MDC0131790.1 TerB family tellurite resistance protein [Alphaproteobacteria bacterium]MDC0148351.1 TerB family tellurite resistance protein [Alphaproteobacteria bacterium]MDC1241074.1 TerB family tellurite resistance protein [bacterium]
MLERLKNILNTQLAEQPVPQPADELHVAAAALLVRAAQIDGHIDDSESALLERLVGPYFGLSEAEASELLVQAHAAIDAANDLFQFTQKINANFQEGHKQMLMQLLWQVVLSDGVVDDYEANLLRRVAGLIHVSDQDAGAARKAAEAALSAS